MRKRVPGLHALSTLEDLRACLGLERMNLLFQSPNTTFCWEGPLEPSFQLAFY